MKYSYLLLFSLLIQSGFAQSQDSVNVLSIDDFYGLVLQNHPVVRQAALLEGNAQQEIRLARGSFDPKLNSNYDYKTLKGSEYWDQWDHELKVPVWFNTDLKVQYQRAFGQYLQEDFVNTENGLLAIGVSVPLGQGMFIDQRRASLRQAQLMIDMAEAEKIKMINKILLSAAKDYWDWYLKYAEYQIRIEALELAEFRLNGIIESVLNGDKAPIDSVEAEITKQNRDIEMQQARIAFLNAGLILSNHLWSPDNEPVELSETVVPSITTGNEFLTTQELQLLLDIARDQHPELRKINAKYSQYEIEQRLNREMLKPQLNLNYNFLRQEGANNSGNEFLFDDNYKFGLEFAFPLLLRKERAKLAKTNIKLMDVSLERNRLRREILNDIRTSYNQLINTTDMITLQQAMVANYEVLVAGEMMKFENGESSLFLVNSRESKLIEARSKLLKLEVNYEKEKAFLMWSAGTSNLGIELVATQQ
ncbi:MAG: TolC family protein [Cyclobacteriaceae bacterium]